MRAITTALMLVTTLVAVSVCAQDNGAEGEDAADAEAREASAREAEEIVLDPNAPPSTEPGCFSVRTVRDFTALHNQYVYVRGRGDEHFLLTMERACIGLRSSETIAIDNQTDRVCSNSQARISYRGPGRRLDTCYIRDVAAVEDRDAARAIVESRTARR